jgi:hypothetical protein
MENKNEERSNDGEEQIKAVVVTNEMEKEEANLENDAKKEEEKVKQEQQKVYIAF